MLPNFEFGNQSRLERMRNSKKIKDFNLYFQNSIAGCFESFPRNKNPQRIFTKNCPLEYFGRNPKVSLSSIFIGETIIFVQFITKNQSFPL